MNKNASGIHIWSSTAKESIAQHDIPKTYDKVSLLI